MGLRKPDAVNTKRYVVKQTVKDIRTGTVREYIWPTNGTYKSRTWAEKAAATRRWLTTPAPEYKPSMDSQAEVVEVF
jgi:hypothetical protein